MKLRYLMATMILMGSSLAWAQVCPSAPGTVCLVPAPGVASTSVVAAAPSTVCPVPTAVMPVTGQVSAYPMGSCPTGYLPTSVMPVQTTSISGTCPTGVSQDTAYLINQISALRGDLYATSLEVRGQLLVDRANRLISDEAIFRQSLIANPNLPGAQVMALSLQNQAIALNRDIASFNRELSMVPADQRPFVASRLNTFETVYWAPTIASLQNFNTTFQQNASAYQPAVAANPWLPAWQTSFQTSLNNISATQQVFASARWWTNPQIQVLGSTEYFYPGTGTMPSGSVMMLPSGAAVYIPAGSIPMSSTSMVTPSGTTTTTLNPTMAY